jgi:hypothetical protein
MYIVWLTVVLLNRSLIASSWEQIGSDIQNALSHGPNAEIKLNGKWLKAAEHFEQLNQFLMPEVVRCGLATPQSFYHVVGVIKQAMAINLLELENYDSYRNRIAYDFTF